MGHFYYNADYSALFLFVVTDNITGDYPRCLTRMEREHRTVSYLQKGNALLVHANEQKIIVYVYNIYDLSIAFELSDGNVKSSFLRCHVSTITSRSTEDGSTFNSRGRNFQNYRGLSHILYITLKYSVRSCKLTTSQCEENVLPRSK